MFHVTGPTHGEDFFPTDRPKKNLEIPIERGGFLPDGTKGTSEET